jgi:outer membrane protein insertion porin family
VVRYASGGLLLIFLFASFAVAQSQFEGQPILDVQYDPPKQPVDPRDLASAQTVKKGAPLHLTDVATAIDRLYATGRYDDIEVDAEPAAGGVIVRFITKSRWFVGHTGVEGKVPQPPNRGSITNGTQLNLGDPYDPKALKAAENTIHRLFIGNGLYEATSKTQIAREDDIQQVNFTFVIKAGKRAKYERPVIEGNTVLSDDTIVRATGWRFRIIHWYRQVTESRTRGGVNGVLKKYQSKDRLMATARITNFAYDAKRRRLKPTLSVHAGPKVEVKALEAKVSQGKLKKYVPVFTERRVDRDLLVEGARNLRDYFQNQGYYDVDVDFRQRQDGPDQVVIEYVISHGQRFKLVKLDIQGNHYFTTDIIRERMFLEPASFRLRHGRYSGAMRDKDEDNIANLYKSNGFHEAKVTSTLVRNYGGKSGDIAVTLRIVEGTQWFVDKVDINGMHEMNRGDVDGILSSLPGQPFSEYNVAVDRTAILSRYYSSGFPNATFRYRSNPSGRPNHVNLVYIINEGKRQYVRDVRITGIHTTQPHVIDNVITLKPDQPLSLTEMTGAQRSLYNLGIFARVDTAVQNPDGNTQYKHVLYDVEEANRYRLNLGVGAEGGSIGGSTTSINSPVSNTGFSPRFSLDVTRLNLFGIGHFATLRGRWSTFDQRASFDYVAPRFRNVEGRNVTFTLLYDLQQNIRTFTSKREEASVQVSQQFTKAVTGLFRFTYRRVSTDNIAIPTLLVPLLAQPVRLGLVSANFAQDRRDNPADAHRGIYNTADINLASNVFGSQRSFLRVLFKDATYHPLKHTWVFARQTTFGVIYPFSIPAGIDATDSIPLPERFFGGGNISHRGFPENQAGPRDIGTPVGTGAQATQPTGFPLGGNAVFLNTFELRFPLIGDNIGGVLFHDAGNVYRSVSDISFRSSQRNLQDFNYMVHAVGFGIRYKTPIGPLRVDLAYSINPPSFLGFKGTYEDLLQCNPTLPSSQLPSQCQSVQQNTGHFQFFFSIGQTF